MDSVGKTQADTVPFGGGATEGTQTFMKKVKELQYRFKKKKSPKVPVKKRGRKGSKGKKLQVKKGPKQRKTKT